MKCSTCDFREAQVGQSMCKLCENQFLGQQSFGQQLRESIRAQARREEREACAKIALQKKYCSDSVGDEIAEQIRARGDKP